MSKFVENVNYYISQRKIKKKYISMKSGIEINKVYRLLNGRQQPTEADMKKIASALGKDIVFFLGDTPEVPAISSLGKREVLYAKEPTEEQRNLFEGVREFIETVDIVVSAKGRYTNIDKED